MLSFWDFAYLFGAPWDTGEPPSELKELVASASLRPGRVLDIGCGTGTNVVYLASKGFEAFGLDISNLAVWKAKRKASKHGVKCQIHRLNFTDSKAVMSAKLPSFDILVDVGCYHSLSTESRERYQRSLLPVSRVGTKYLLWCFLKSAKQSFGPPGVTPEEVENRFSKAFQILEKRELKSSYRDMLFYLMERTT